MNPNQSLAPLWTLDRAALSKIGSGYNRKIPLRFWHSSFFLLETEKKNKSFPSKQKKVCNQGSNPGSSMVPSPLHYHANTTEIGRNLIIQIQFSIFFVIESHGLFFRIVLYSGTPLYGHLVIMVTFFDRPAKRPRPSLIRSTRYYGQFFLTRWWP